MKRILLLAAALGALGPQAAPAVTWELSADGTYRVSDAPITETEFVTYLNASNRADSDTCGYFYTAAMATNGITRSGSAGSYSYGGGSSSPIAGLTLHAAMAFANYQDGGEDTGPYDPLVTEVDIGHCGYGSGVAFPERDAGTTFWIPDYDEWHDSIGTTSLDDEITDTYLGGGGYKTSDGLTIGIAAQSTGRGLHLARAIVDDDADGVDDELADNCPDDANANQADSDTDGIGNVCDRCSSDSRNTGSKDCDTDADGYGNVCDGDFDENEYVGAIDYSHYFLPAFNGYTSPTHGEDMDCNGSVLPGDYSQYFLPQYNATIPGPSGRTCAGTVPCP